MDYEALIEFWRERSQSGSAIFFDPGCVWTLQDAIKSKRDIEFEIRFWMIILFNCHPYHVVEDVIGVLVSGLRRSNPDRALESYRSLLNQSRYIRSRPAYIFTQEVDRIFKKKGDIQGEVEFWKTVVRELPPVEEAFWNRLMRLFKRSGDVDQAVKFWNELVSLADWDVSQQKRLQQKLSEIKKWKKEVEAALTFRGLASGEQ
jgi:tetratricopeptide (TPR) repeat protein